MLCIFAHLKILILKKIKPLFSPLTFGESCRYNELSIHLFFR
ncbi:hypothetical protein MITSMUL_03998 [Mitsuokella multacida DSM 20544]|uniref:Uncharacterized protein n=1 Tax=Mitsuokella multacida DSM 20544 TaxID=500635 RepID=C9KL99_9FIRM|nr:hypothetical protein MITSMUL_03998 [Mitsuokella multacida DSM 20544]